MNKLTVLINKSSSILSEARRINETRADERSMDLINQVSLNFTLLEGVVESFEKGELEKGLNVEVALLSLEGLEAFKDMKADIVLMGREFGTLSRSVYDGFYLDEEIKEAQMYLTSLKRNLKVANEAKELQMAVGN